MTSTEIKDILSLADWRRVMGRVETAVFVISEQCLVRFRTHNVRTHFTL